MTSKEIGIEEARKILGALVTAAQHGTDIILTRNRRPVARIVPCYQEDPMPTTPLPTLSEGTTAAIANLVDYTVDREYDRDVEAAMNGAAILALAGLQFDLRDQFMELNHGSDEGLDGYAQATLRVLVRKGLEQRVCQCRTRYGACPHPSNPGGLPCANHTEADVPAINGLVLCGPCHTDEYQTRGE